MSDNWLAELIGLTYAWAADCGYRITTNHMSIRVAILSGAEHELEYYG